MKDAYAFKKHVFPKILWAKHIWSKDIPPSKSLFVWRLMLNKLPKDDNLDSRGCQIPSMCSMCMNQVETSFHLFFDCPYAIVPSPPPPQVYEVIWQPPIHDWVKSNTGGASNPQTVAAGGIFRDNEANFLLGFTENVGEENAYFAELSAAMRAIELSCQYNWMQL